VKTSNIFVIVLLVAAAIGSWYLSRARDASEVTVTSTPPVNRGFYLKSARILGTGPEGNLLYEIRADRAEQQLDGSIEFTDVRLDYSPDSAVPWSVDADNATILPHVPKVQLRGHVRAVSTQGVGDGDTEIRTQYLELDPERYLAETDDRVQIRIGERSLTATGMLASLNDSRLELRSNVSGKFLP